jgi:hypothetical protein
VRSEDGLMAKFSPSMNSDSSHELKVGDPVRLKDSDMRLRGDVWQLRTGRYVIVRWEDRARTTHSESAVELDGERAPVQKKNASGS